ncbi:hypothetical protein ACFOZ7_18030 [Natribaculum luteum]|uniref:MarR family transcriptional regulator n=1 Tax=Natribaculum luteum TaxID=1586232 RepID=A0ABD5P3B1_9EURY|nr:hypothetical protein [Natribaculum luteum]
MKTVRDDDGRQYLLLKRSSNASLVRDPSTGNECYISNDRLEPVDECSPLEMAATGIDESLRKLVRGVHDDRTLGFLLELDDRGPTSVRVLADRYDFCESDLHGRLAELTAAGLIEEADVAGERGYRVTDDCRMALEVVRNATRDD